MREVADNWLVGTVAMAIGVLVGHYTGLGWAYALGLVIGAVLVCTAVRLALRDS
jgi:hypothetical protein